MTLSNEQWNKTTTKELFNKNDSKKRCSNHENHYYWFSFMILSNETHSILHNLTQHYHDDYNTCDTTCKLIAYTMMIMTICLLILCFCLCTVQRSMVRRMPLQSAHVWMNVLSNKNTHYKRKQVVFCLVLCFVLHFIFVFNFVLYKCFTVLFNCFLYLQKKTLFSFHIHGFLWCVAFSIDSIRFLMFQYHVKRCYFLV